MGLARSRVVVARVAKRPSRQGVHHHPPEVSSLVKPAQARAVADHTYAAQVKDAVLTRDSSGRIMSAVENGVTVTYTRDSQGRIASETRNGKTTTYTRDGAGRVSGWATV